MDLLFENVKIDFLTQIIWDFFSQVENTNCVIDLQFGRVDFDDIDFQWLLVIKTCAYVNLNHIFTSQHVFFVQKVQALIC